MIRVSRCKKSRHAEPTRSRFAFRLARGRSPRLTTNGRSASNERASKRRKQLVDLGLLGELITKCRKKGQLRTSLILAA